MAGVAVPNKDVDAKPTVGPAAGTKGFIGEHEWRDDDFCTATTGKHTKKKRSDEIICPVLAMMYNAGDITPDENGFVSLTGLLAGVRKIGINDRDVAMQVTLGSHRDGGVNIFTLEKHGSAHTVGTGIRHSQTPSQEAFENLTQFAKEEGGKKKLSLTEMAKGINAQKKSKFVTKGGGNFAGESDEGMGVKKLPDGSEMDLVYWVVFARFGRPWGGTQPAHPWLFVEELRTMLLDGLYPEEWKPRVMDNKAGMSSLIELESEKVKDNCGCSTCGIM